MSSFEFATSSRIVFGAGKWAVVLDWLRELDVQRVLIVTGRSLERAQPLLAALDERAIAHERFLVTREPSVELAREGSARCVQGAFRAVVALGGGSAIDAGKAIAALATNGGEPLDFLEVVGRGQPLRHAPLPFAAIPTTAGTGAEVTRNAVLSSAEHGVKASLRSAAMLPSLAIVDPELLLGADPAVLRASGLDALSQLIEPFVSCKANPLCDALAREGLLRSRRSLRAAVLHGSDAQQREDLALASLLGGLCLANAGLGAVHGFAAPAGGMFHAPHGAVCAALLPHVLDVNLRALQTRAAHDPLLDKYRELAAILTGDAAARAEDAVTWLRDLCRDLSVPGLGAYGMNERDLPVLVERAARASSMRGNSLPLTEQELLEIAKRALS